MLCLLSYFDHWVRRTTADFDIVVDTLYMRRGLTYQGDRGTEDIVECMSNFNASVLAAIFIRFRRKRRDAQRLRHRASYGAFDGIG